MSTDVPMKRCPRCKGRKDFDCPDCYGTGEVIDIAELEAALGRLRVCGTCGHMEQWDDDAPGCHYEICNIDFGGGVGDAEVASPCRLSPSRWTPYWDEP